MTELDFIGGDRCRGWVAHAVEVLETELARAPASSFIVAHVDGDDVAARLLGPEELLVLPEDLAPKYAALGGFDALRSAHEAAEALRAERGLSPQEGLLVLLVLPDFIVPSVVRRVS